MERRPSGVLIFALTFILLAMPSVFADLQFYNLPALQPTSHNSNIPLTFGLNNTGTDNVGNITVNMSNFPTNVGDFVIIKTIPILRQNETNQISTTLNVPQYYAPGTYNIIVRADGTGDNTPYSDSFNLALNINQSKNLLISTTVLSVSVAAGIKDSTSFSIQNVGNVNLTSISIIKSNELRDSRGRTISIGFTPSADLSIIQPSQSVTINLNYTIPSGIDIGSYSTNITVNTAEGVQQMLKFTITLAEGYCENGIKGEFFGITIREPKSGDDFYPGDTIPVEVRVRNSDTDDRDVVVNANLYDATDADWLDAEVETTGSISDRSSETFDIDLIVPVDITTHDIRLYAKAYEDGSEDEQCISDFVSIDIKKQTHAMSIEKITAPDTVSCSNTFNLVTRLANTGKKDENVKLAVTNPELKINEEKELKINTGDEKDITMSLVIPKDATEKSYDIDVVAYYYLSGGSYGDSTTDKVSLKVEGNCVQPKPVLTVTTETVAQPYTEQQGSLRVTLFNRGDKTGTFKITVSGTDSWARLDKIDPSSLTIGAGDSASSTIYFTSLQGVKGTESMKVSIIYDTEKIDKDVSFNIQQKTTSPYQGFAVRLSNLGRFDLMLIAINIILVIVIILVLIIITRARRA